MSVEVTINSSLLERALRRPGGLGERILRSRADRVAARARQLAPGSMGRYISVQVDGGGRGLAAYVVCSHPAAGYVVRGTRPHVIRPRRARALRFEIGGRIVFAKTVHHPGTRPNNFLMQAAREVL